MNFLEELQAGHILLLDGGMGTMLNRLGLGLGGAVNNLEHQAEVTQVHQAYLAAGSRCLYTNTFSLNRIYAASHGLEIDLALCIRQGVAAAQAAAKEDTYVFGDIGPTGQMLAPLGDGDPAAIKDAFLEQAQVLATAGVDGFVVETMFDIEESLLAVQACREAAENLPILASMTFSTLSRGGRTIMGNKAADCANRLAVAGVSVVGANCGDLTPEEMAEIVKEMKGAGIPIMVKPNAGKPRLEGTETLYDMPPEVFAQGVMACLEAGAQMAGGCCGTTPEHIAAIREQLAR